MPPTLKASMFCSQPRLDSLYAPSKPCTRLESTEPQMKRSSRGTPNSLIAFAKPRWFCAKTEAKKLR